MIAFAMACALIGCNSTRSMNSENAKNARDDGWINLFDGRSTAGWHSYGKTSAGTAWKAENGILHLDGASKKTGATGGDLLTNEEFENFHLKLEWKIAPKGNSGIIFLVKDDIAAYPNTYNSGLEMQVLDNGTPTEPGHSDAKIYTHRAGDLYDLLAGKEAAKTAGEWNTAEIICNKGKLDFHLNGIHTLSTTMWDEPWNKMIAISKFRDMKNFGTFRKGRIALQDHGDDVWYRNIMIRKL